MGVKMAISDYTFGVSCYLAWCPFHTCNTIDLTNTTATCPPNVRTTQYNNSSIHVSVQWKTVNIPTITHGMPLRNIICQLVFTILPKGKVMRGAWTQRVRSWI